MTPYSVDDKHIFFCVHAAAPLNCVIGQINHVTSCIYDSGTNYLRVITACKTKCMKRPIFKLRDNISEIALRFYKP